MAEGIYNKYIPGKAISAGVTTAREDYHSKPHPGVVQVMLEFGIDIGHQLVKVLTEDMTRQTRRIITFHDKEKCPDYVQNNPKTTYVFIEDPGINVKGPEHISEDILQDFRNTRDSIERVICGILTNGR
jgi:protein-tyrosine-phosphatase